MRRFQPVINKFKSAFFDGGDSDGEASETIKARGRGRGRGTATNGSSQASQNAKGRAYGQKRPRASAAASINQACFEVSDEDEPKPTSAKRRKVAAKESVKGAPAPTSQASSRLKGQNPESQENVVNGQVLSEEEILKLTVPKLREICVLNNLGGEKALKKELVRLVTEHFASLT